MSQFTTRSNCRREPAKYVPIITEVQVCDIPDNFPKSCKKMIGKIYLAIVRTDRKGNTWYKIPKDLVFGNSESFGVAFAFQKQDPEKVSFENRTHIDLPAKCCN